MADSPENRNKPAATANTGLSPQGLLNDQAKDSYTQFGRDPRLSSRFDTSSVIAPVPNPFDEELAKLVISTDDEQHLYDELRLYKRRKTAEIAKLEDRPFENRALILSQLSQLAGSLLKAVYNHIKKQLETKIGIPHYLSSYQQWVPTELAVISMGKLGAGEINYESDLDLVFIYSHIGETRGHKIISNSEYYAKFVQRLINMLSLQTGAGRLYEIDTELRPSGNSGTLVISVDHFLDHQMNRSQNWERQALLRADVAIASPELSARLQDFLTELCYDRPLPADYFSSMHEIRERVLKEKVHEKENIVDIKKGPGGIMDIEFIMHAIQLKFGKIHPRLRYKSTFALVDILKAIPILDASRRDNLARVYTLLRTVESTLQLEQKRSTDNIDTASETFALVATRLGYADAQSLSSEIIESRTIVRELYLSIFTGNKFG